MLNKEALDLLQPSKDGKKQMRISSQNGLIVIEFAKDTGWVAMTRDETIQLIRLLADRLNAMAVDNGDKIIGRPH